MARFDDLAGKAVLIAGASSGVGSALACAFGAQGTKLALHFNRIPANGGTYMP